MTDHPRAEKRAEESACGARLPLHRVEHDAVAAGAESSRGRGSGRHAPSGWLLPPKTGRRRVDTLRVRRLFG